MRFLRLLPGLLVVFLAAITVTAQGPTGQAGDGAGGRARAAGRPIFDMTMGFPDGGLLLRENSGLGAMMSPEINWTNPPAGTMSFVLSMNDIDFSRNHTMEGMIHWLVWNIPASATGLPEGVPMGQLANGAYQISASGQMYRAPVGAGRKPRYIFELLALDTKLDVQPDQPFETRAKVFAAAQGHIVQKIAYVATFGPNDAQPGPIPAR
jgi:Raf kinase inhibitor-like YbhB/YbcL family protein